MVPMICIVGYSNSGKTTLIEKLIPQLKSRGVRVGTIKHTDHEPSLDTQGKDSWRHFTAGADSVIVSSPEKIALIKKKEEPIKNGQDDLSGLEAFFSDVDIILVEGYKNARKPKIEIFRQTIHDKPMFIDSDLLLALVTDADVACRVPRFAADEIDKLADLIETFLKNHHQETVHKF